MLKLFMRSFRGVAQLVEQRSPKPCVASSSLATPATKYNGLSMAKKRRYRWFRIIGFVLFFMFGLVNLGMFLVVMILEDERYIASLKPEIVDEQAPTIVLNGASETKVLVNSKYEEPGAEVFDNRSEPELKIEGEVNTSITGDYVIKYSAIDEVGNEAEATRKVSVIEPYRIIYLTFDDGPGQYTAELLDILKKYNIHATFFVTGAGSDELLKREYEEGHAIGLHTFSHNYSYIYTSSDAFWADLIRVQERVEAATGYKSFLMRFPGGSSNTVSRRYDGRSRIMTTLTREAGERGFTYFDWNITSGDAGETTSTDVIVENVIYQLKEGSSIVLQHDIKGFSVAAVERIIQYGLENGYTFMKLDATSPTAHHPVNN